MQYLKEVCEDGVCLRRPTTGRCQARLQLLLEMLGQSTLKLILLSCNNPPSFDVQAVRPLGVLNPLSAAASSMMCCTRY